MDCHETWHKPFHWREGHTTLCLTEHHAIKTYWGSRGISPFILILRTRWSWVVNFTPRPLYPGTSAQNWYLIFKFMVVTHEPLELGMCNFVWRLWTCVQVVWDIVRRACVPCFQCEEHAIGRSCSSVMMFWHDCSVAQVRQNSVSVPEYPGTWWVLLSIHQMETELSYVTLRYFYRSEPRDVLILTSTLRHRFFSPKPLGYIGAGGRII